MRPRPLIMPRSLNLRITQISTFPPTLSNKSVPQMPHIINDLPGRFTLLSPRV